MKITGTVISTRVNGTSRRTVSFVLQPWQEDDASPSAKRLSVTVVPSLAPTKAKAVAALVGTGRTVSFVAKERIRQGLREISATLPVAVAEPSAALLHLRAELAAPIRDPFLGLLELDDEVWTGARSLRGQGYEVTVWRPHDSESRARDIRAIAAAAKVVRAIEKNLPAIRAAAVTDILPKYNAMQDQDGNRKLGVRAIAAKFRLESLDVAESGTTVYFAVGGLFADCGVQVHLGPRGAVRKVVVA